MAAPYLSRTALRQRFSTAIDAALPSTFAVSVYPYLMFGNLPESVQDRRFVVGLGRSVALDERQRVADGALVLTEVRVALIVQVRPNGIDLQADVDAAEDDLATLLQAVATASRAYTDIELRSIESPEMLDNSAMLHEVRYRVLHALDLAGVS